MVDKSNLSLWKNKTALVFALEQIPFFDDLSSDEMTILMNYMSLYELEVGETLFKEGEIGQYVSFVVEGKMDVLKKSITGSEISIATISHGYAIGEMALIDQSPRSATIRAQTQATLAVLPQSAFKIILENQPSIGIKILTGFARFQTENLRKTSDQLNAYTHLLSTVCNHKGSAKLPKKLGKLLDKDEKKLLKSHQSVSTLSNSKVFLKKVKDILNTEII
jgi:CRP/FNR family cyclic AMP-dependent transcriptional regulator